MPPVCQDCKRAMGKVVARQTQPKGDWVTYECINGGCPTYLKSDMKYRNREKIFEAK